jgi:hypothetical protein
MRKVNFRHPALELSSVVMVTWSRHPERSSTPVTVRHRKYGCCNELTRLAIFLHTTPFVGRASRSIRRSFSTIIRRVRKRVIWRSCCDVCERLIVVDVTDFQIPLLDYAVCLVECSKLDSFRAKYLKFVQRTATTATLHSPEFFDYLNGGILLMREGRTTCLPSWRRELRNELNKAVKDLWQAVVRDLFVLFQKMEPITCRAQLEPLSCRSDKLMVQVTQ